jgi:phosphopantothenoylcysteine decarboxylase/phosphopantothenate--cysteine ligase
MWNDPATLTNVETLRNRGLVVLEPEVGPLTSGDVGQGRFPETATILAALEEISQSNFDLLGKTVLVTAGGTREPIDSVRFIGNQSSGKQGYAVARTALRRGASVTLISANTTLEEIEGVKTLRVETAQEMLEILTDEFPRCDILVMAAAVADAKPESVKHGKIKKADFSSINLVKNPDLLQTVTARKSQQVVIAFAAESTHDSSSAEAKLLSKGADILYLNDISHGDIFNSETTYGEIFINGGPSVKVAKTTKDTLANQLLDQAILKLS